MSLTSMHQPHLPLETTVCFFEVKSNYCRGASARTLSVCVRVHARAPARARARAPLKTPSDERGAGDVERERAAQPRFHLSPL